MQLQIYGSRIITDYKVKPGWNLISYPFLYEMQIEDYLACFDNSENITQIKDAREAYNKVSPDLNSLTTIKPGNAYWVHSDLTHDINLSLPVYNISNDIFYIDYDPSLESDLTWCMTLFNSIINTSNSNYQYFMDIECKDLPTGSLGLAWSRPDWIKNNEQYNYGNLITLNKEEFSYTYYLNDERMNINKIILVHELLHVLGLVGVYNNDSSLIHDESADPSYVYLGQHGIEQYKIVLQNNTTISNTDITDISYIPLENNFGSGTILNHFEEGSGPGVGDIQTRIIDGITYPVIKNEIITGFIDNVHNFLTSMTVGCLEDIGFDVCYNSQYIKITNIYPIQVTILYLPQATPNEL
jgi:hypothetical protein